LTAQSAGAIVSFVLLACRGDFTGFSADFPSHCL